MSYQERYTAYQEAIETYLNTIFFCGGQALWQAPGVHSL